MVLSGEMMQQFHEVSTSMLSIAPTVTRLSQNLSGHTVLFILNCAMAAFPTFVDIFDYRSLLIESPR